MAAAGAGKWVTRVSGVALATSEAPFLATSEAEFVRATVTKAKILYLISTESMTTTLERHNAFL